ncbi:PE family protein, partial [Staphylococcus aureus]|nr:PE family protein [Staphylococcus aureus]
LTTAATGGYSFVRVISESRTVLSRTAITVVNAIVPPAADPVSNRMVGRILEHMAQYQQISSQALEYLRGFSQGLAENAE